MARSPISPIAHEALHLLAAAIRAKRISKQWSISELAERAGVSHPTIIKIERGDPTVAIGTAFEAAALLGIPLFDPDPSVRALHADRLKLELSLLPRAARRSAAIDDNF